MKGCITIDLLFSSIIRRGKRKVKKKEDEIWLFDERKRINKKERRARV